MAQESLVVFVNLIVEQCLLIGELAVDRQFKPLYNATQYRFVEHHGLSLHHRAHITTGEQFATLKDNTVGTGIEYIHPQLLVEYLACEDEHLDLRI